MKGFSLIELLIALWILAFALFGIAGIQILFVSRNYDAYLQSVAVNQINSIFNRCRLSDWNKNNIELLPEGKGSKNGNKISLCWYQRSHSKKTCLNYD